MSDDGAKSGEDSEDPSPRPDQQEIIDSDDYPMRVLAGAGTGKTFTMVEKIERLLETGTPPDEILALTFTNKAADSMREKLVEKVDERGYDIEAYTYHAVCNELLSDFAYHADLDPRFDVATEADQLQLVYEVLDEIPYRFTNPDVYENHDYATGAPERLFSFIESMKRAGITPEELDAYLPTPERLAELEGVVDRVREATDEHLRTRKDLTAERLDLFDGWFDEFVSVLKTERNGLGGSGMEADVAAYIDAMIETVDALSAFFHDNADRLNDGEFANGHKLPAHLFDSYSGAPAGMPSIEFTLPGTLEAFINDCQEVSDLVPGYRAYQQALRAENLLDFNDLVTETVALLENQTVTDWLDDQYSYVFCDEYQDTDALQFELVQRLVTDDRLFVVGDDDQAIYEWRGANVDNIGPRLEAAYPSLASYTLEENFRSKQPILDLANNALDELGGRGSDKELDAMFEKADADDGVIHVEAAEELDDEGQQVTNAVTRLVDGQSVHTDETYAPSDIAILVRKKRHAKPLIETLSKAGIPYELGGDIAAESVGVETVIAGLKAVADPADEVSINRLLTMRYRLRADDLRRLNTAEDSLRTALETLDPSAYEEPERVERSAADLTHLWSQRDTYSLTRLYRELKDRLDLEWFLSEQERRDLRQLDDLIDSFEDGTVEPELSSDFIDFLARHGSITADSSRGLEDQPDESAAGVRIMTIHKSKGLEFPVVVLPELVADEWAPRERTYDRIETALDAEEPSPTEYDPLLTDEREARRLLHVAITRAEEWCLLFGRTSEANADDRDSEEMRPETVDTALGDAVPWSVSGVSFPIWETVRRSLPPTAVDGTETIAAPIETDTRTAAVDGARLLDRTEARRRVLDLGRRALAGDLDVSPDARIEIATESVGVKPESRLQRRHSYTSLDAVAECPRQHYLNYVVRAFDDPQLATADEAGDGSSVNTRTQGVVFHEAAERAGERGYTRPDEWKQAAERIARMRGEEAVLPAVETCIDRFFELEASEWTILSAERDFELELDGELVVGQIDALCRTPEGELVVLDYKATDRTRDLETNLQLPLYVLACRELFDEPVERAGYAYVGSAGPKLATRRFDEGALDAATERIHERLQAAVESSYSTFQQNDHCRWCPHAGLPCGPEGYGESDEP
ncbi:ATP-dependent helicase [Natronomonas sp.]|uniref:ATP-dependent helicase n=1 Tax=Natronomonas sp. TaxID=2184060 RepID=UPI002FC2F728